MESGASRKTQKEWFTVSLPRIHLLQITSMLFYHIRSFIAISEICSSNGKQNDAYSCGHEITSAYTSKKAKR